MGSIHRIGRRRKQKVKGTPQLVERREYEGMELDARVALVQELIPLGLMAVSEELQREVSELAGCRYARKASDDLRRHGTNPGSVRLAGQRVPMDVPRVRGPGGEVPLESYGRYHRGTELDDRLFRQVLYGVSCRNYEAAAQAVPGAIGLSKSSVSREFVKASEKKLREFEARDLSTLDVVVLFIDGKTFTEDEMVIALAVTSSGQKVPIGFIQTDTENEPAISDFLRKLLMRGLDIDSGLLVVLDGSKGLRAAVRKTFKKRALVQRCQWHKRENVVSYLPKAEQRRYRRRLQRAYELSTYDAAKKALMAIHADLLERNPSAAASLEEGLEETLTLHRLGVFAQLGRSLKTTNCLESINALAEERCHRVDAWKNGKHKHRWLAAALLDIEPRLKRLFGYRHLPLLREALMSELNLLPDAQLAKAA